MPPVARDQIDREAEILRHFRPQRGELAGIGRQHFIAGIERIDQRRFPSAGAGSCVNDHGIVGLEDGLDAFEAMFGQYGEFGAAMVDGRVVDGAQNPVGNVRGAGDLKEVSAWLKCHFVGNSCEI